MNCRDFNRRLNVIAVFETQVATREFINGASRFKQSSADSLVIQMRDDVLANV